MPASHITPEELAQTIGEELSTLTYFAYRVRESCYYEGQLAKRSGGIRTIHRPVGQLKGIQRKIAGVLGQLYQPEHSAHGYIAGRGILSNARNHVAKRWLLKVDLQDFFGTIHFGRILGLLKASPYNFPLDTARLIANLSCYRGFLPQGSPLSPILSNMVSKPLDRALRKLAREVHCYYSRYVDDLSFSGFQSFPPNDLVAVESGILTVGGRLREIIEVQNNFKINPDKLRVKSRAQRQAVTGIIVNKKPNVSRKYVCGFHGKPISEYSSSRSLIPREADH